MGEWLAVWAPLGWGALLRNGASHALQERVGMRALCKIV